MATGVGLHIAEHACTAAVVSDEGDPHFIVREPILHMSEDGDAALGGATAPPGYTHTITGFVAAVGDPAGVVVDDGEAYRGEDLLATAMFCLINLLTEHLHGPAEFYATHPADWPAAQVLALRDALDYLGLKSVALIGEDELPQPSAHAPAQDPGHRIAESAGLAALTVVLDTPAGATPPDPGTAENSSLDTVVMPKIGDTPAKAYSAVTPVVDPEATYGGPSLGALAAGLGVAAVSNEGPDKGSDTADPPNTEATGATGAATAATPAPVPAPGTARKAGNGKDKKGEEPEGSRRTTVLVAVAALAGLLIGALGVTAFLRPGSAEPGVPTTTSMTTTPAAPPPPPAAPPPIEPTQVPEPTQEPEPSYPAEPPAPVTEPPVTTTEPPTTETTAPTETSAPGSTEPSDPTTTPNESGTESTTTRSRPTFMPPLPLPFSPDSPEMGLPDTGSQEGSREEAG